MKKRLTMNEYLYGLGYIARERFFSIWELAKEGIELDGEEKIIAEIMRPIKSFMKPGTTRMR